MIMQSVTQKNSKENENEIHYTYCNTEITSKTYMFVWDINNIFTTCKLISNLKLTTAEDQLPFNIFLNTNDEKLIYSVKSASTIKAMICYAQLRSHVSVNKCYNLPCMYDGEKYNFEIYLSFLSNEGKEFTQFDNCKIIFKVQCIESILHNTIDTTTVHHNNKIYAKNLYANNISKATIMLTVDNKELYVNKELLCAKSEYFKTWLDDYKNTTISIDDTSSEIVLMFIDYINSNDTSAIEKADIIDLLMLFKMAISYHVKDLKSICEQNLKENILIREDVLSEDKLRQVLLFAYFNDIKELLTFTINYIVLNINFINHSFYTDIKTDYPILFILFKEAIVKTNEAQGIFG